MPVEVNAGLAALEFRAGRASEIFDLAAYLTQLLHVRGVKRMEGYDKGCHKVQEEGHLHITWRQCNYARRVPPEVLATISASR